MPCTQPLFSVHSIYGDLSPQPSGCSTASLLPQDMAKLLMPRVYASGLDLQFPCSIQLLDTHVGQKPLLFAYFGPCPVGWTLFVGLVSGPEPLTRPYRFAVNQTVIPVDRKQTSSRLNPGPPMVDTQCLVQSVARTAQPTPLKCS